MRVGPICAKINEEKMKRTKDMDWLEIRKKAENFWYYYKWYVIGGIFLLGTVLAGITTCKPVKNIDLHMLYLRDDTPNAAQVAEMEEWLSPMSPDLNKDGVKAVKIMGVSRSNMWSGDDSAAMVVQINSGDAILYLVSDTAYETLHANGVLQDLSSVGESEFLEEDRYRISDAGILNEMEGFAAEEGRFNLCIRRVKGTSFEGKPQYTEQEKAAFEVLKKIIEKEKSEK